MSKKSLNNKGFAPLLLLIGIAAVLVVGGGGAYVYHQNHKPKSSAVSDSSTTTKTSTQTSNSQQSAASSTQQAKTSAMSTWSTFSNTTLGLTFRYPSDWGQTSVTTMNATQANANGTFYKISFGEPIYITVHPQASLQASDTTFGNLQTDDTTFASSRHVFINEATVVGAIVPSTGNQDAEIYAARSIGLSKVNASDIVLFDSRAYSGSCSQDSYVGCYTTDELNDYQWLLESASTL